MNDDVDTKRGDTGDEEGSSRLLSEANAAALVGDPRGMLTALYKSHVLDGICWRLAAAWGAIAFEDIQLLVAEAVDVLYEKVRNGEKIRRIVPYLLKVSTRKAYDFHESRCAVDAVDPADLETAVGKEARRRFESKERQAEASTSEPVDDLDYEERRRIALRIARGLLPRLGQQRIQDVMGYIFDAIEAGHEDIPNEDIEDALGLSAETVRTAKSRGFARLSRIGKEEKLLPRNFDLLGLDSEADEDQ